MRWWAERQGAEQVAVLGALHSVAVPVAQRWVVEQRLAATGLAVVPAVPRSVALGVPHSAVVPVVRVLPPQEQVPKRW